MSSGLVRFQQSGETGTALSPFVGVVLPVKGKVGMGMWRGMCLIPTMKALLAWLGLGVGGFRGSCREELQNMVQSKHLLWAGCAMVQGSHLWF